MRVSADPGVVLDQSQAVDDGAGADAGKRADDRAGEHGGAVLDDGAATDLGARMAKRDQGDAARQRPLGGETAEPVVTDAERRPAMPARGQPGEIGVVAEDREIEDAARRVRRDQPGENDSAREQRIGDRARVAAGADDEDAGGRPIRRNRISPRPGASR